MINQDILTPTYFYLLNILMIFRHSCLRLQRIHSFPALSKKALEYLQAWLLLQKFVEHKKFMMALALFYARNFIFCVSD